MPVLRLRAWAWLLCWPLWAVAQNTHYERYIETYKDIAVEQMLLHGVPASITLAQGLLESGAGRSTLAVKANNHFGIKCGGSWDGPYILRDDDYKNEKFRVYDSPRQSYEDHSLFLRSRQRYAFLFSLKRTDYKGWAHGLKKAGYATNPRYAYNLIDIIERYGLARFDRVKKLTASGSGRPQASVKSRTARQEAAAAALALRIGRCNGNYYVVARAGDTYASVARETGVKERKLRKYNEAAPGQELRVGDIVFLEKKSAKADPSLKGVRHTVKAGESMHRIAQTYAVRMETLYKINRLPADHVPQVGERILIRK